MRATYSPEDNKLRLRSENRLDEETVERLKAAGFRWAPIQKLWVCPAWSPGRATVLESIAGEIEDEDVSLVERATERAERFEDRGEARKAAAIATKQAADDIAGGIPFGQPILVGHHSQRRAEKDAEKIESGIKKAVKLWESSQYWTDRAAGAIQAAKYKEKPAVRARRIKSIESDLRSATRDRDRCELWLQAWKAIDAGLTQEAAVAVAGKQGISASFPLDKYPRKNETASRYEGSMSIYSALCDEIITPEQARDICVGLCNREIATANAWIAHHENRLAYERAMLAESGGLVADRKKPEVGGAIRFWASRGGFWFLVKKVNKVSVTVLDVWNEGGRSFPRKAQLDEITGVMARAEVDAARAAGRLVNESERGFLLVTAAPEPLPKPPAVEPDATTREFEALADAVRGRQPLVQTVVADQLFETPDALADRLVDMANIRPGDRVLEPSAGTGSLLRAMLRQHGNPYYQHIRATAVEINPQLWQRLSDSEFAMWVTARHADFLEWSGSDAGKCEQFDRIIMNPPFKDGSDVKHITRALSMLAPGGRLVAICAAGPRQRAAFEKLGELECGRGEWHDLPAGSFADKGTNVSTAIVVVDAPAADNCDELATNCHEASGGCSLGKGVAAR